MRVLATAGRKLGRRTDAECSYLGLIAALRASGIKVEQGLVAEGQDLSKYDLVLVEVPNPTYVKSDRFAGAVWALSGTTTPAVAIYDHWNIIRLHLTLGRLTKLHGWFGKTIARILNHDVVSAVNAFPWGHRAGFEWATWCYDPSMFMTFPITYHGMEQRERKWVLATYEDHRKWLSDENLAWPVEEYGRANYGRKMIELPDLMQRYAACWGGVIPPYGWLKGSGYWRNRLVHMAQVRSLFHQDWEDADVMGKPFQLTAEDFLPMNSQELQVVANAQSKWFFDNVWSADKFISEAKAFVERSAA